MAAEKLDPVGNHTKQHQSEDFPGAIVIPSAAHNKKGQADDMHLVQVELDKDESTVYDNGVYLGLASGRMKGEPEEDIIREAARITVQIRSKKLPYAEALVSTRANGEADSENEVLVALPPESAPEEAGAPVRPDELHLPNVRVTYEGSFGTIRTRYHSAELNGEFLVLIFDKRCKIVDMYAPPTGDELLKVTVGEGDKQKEYYTVSLGVNLDLDAKTINRYIVVLPTVPPDHEMVLEQLGADGPPIEGDLGPAMEQPESAVPGLGQTGL